MSFYQANLMSGDAHMKSNKRVTIFSPTSDHVTSRYLQIADASEMPRLLC